MKSSSQIETNYSLSNDDRFFFAHEKILDTPVCTASATECINLIHSWVINSEINRYFACINPHSLEVARGDSEFRKSLANADLLVPDGVGIIIASYLLGGRIRNRVTGSDIFHGVCTSLNSSFGKKMFFLGSSEENLLEIKRKIAIDYPNIEVVGTFSPPYKSNFSDKENQEIIHVINNARPDILWVGMTAPKQEKWIIQNRNQLNVKFIGAIGAVFDFYTGNIKRSNPVFQKFGLEWLPRLIRQPRKLWRRNFISNPSFIVRVIYHRFRYRIRNC